MRNSPTIVVVSHDRVLFAKNSDRDPNESQVLEWVPAADHAAWETFRCTWIEIPQVDSTNAVLESHPPVARMYWRKRDRAPEMMAATTA